MIFVDFVDRLSGFTWTVEAHVLPREGEGVSLDAEFFPAPAAAGYVVRQVMHRFVGTRHEIEVDLDIEGEDT